MELADLVELDNFPVVTSHCHVRVVVSAKHYTVGDLHDAIFASLLDLILIFQVHLAVDLLHLEGEGELGRALLWYLTSKEAHILQIEDVSVLVAPSFNFPTL